MYGSTEERKRIYPCHPIYPNQIPEAQTEKIFYLILIFFYVILLLCVILKYISQIDYNRGFNIIYLFIYYYF